MALWKIIFLELLSITFVAFTIESITTFIHIQQWNKCPPSESKIESFSDVSLQTCSKKCDIIQGCFSFNYFPRGKLCELLNNDNWTIEEIAIKRPCIHGERSTHPFKNVCLGRDSGCSVKACGQVADGNATIYGNIYTVGSKIKVECRAGYRTGNGTNDTLPIVCDNDGNWTNAPTCSAICEEQPAAVPNAVTGPENAAERYYKCNEGFRTSMNTTYLTKVCRSNGNWTSPLSGCIKNTADANGAISYMFGFLYSTMSGDDHLCVYVVASYQTTINISSPLQSYRSHVKMTNGTEIVIPSYLSRSNYTGTFKDGFLLESTAPVEIYIENGLTGSADGSVVIPEKHLSNEYILLSWTNTRIRRAEFAVVGTVDDTEIKVFLRNGSQNLLKIDRYQVYHYQTPDDISGTIIQSSKNVAVFAGHDCTNLITPYCDHLYEQMPPVRDLQKEFIVSYPYPRYKYVFRITTITDKTKIVLSNGESVTLDRTKVWQKQITGVPIYIKATNPILVAVYSLGRASKPAGLPNDFDGSMLIVPGLSQFKSEYHLFVPESVTRCVLMITYPSYRSNINNIRLNHTDFIAKKAVDVFLTGRGPYTILYAELLKGSGILYTVDGTPFGAYLSFFRFKSESWFSLPYRF